MRADAAPATPHSRLLSRDCFHGLSADTVFRISLDNGESIVHRHVRANGEPMGNRWARCPSWQSFRRWQRGCGAGTRCESRGDRRSLFSARLGTLENVFSGIYVCRLRGAWGALGIVIDCCVIRTRLLFLQPSFVKCVLFVKDTVLGRAFRKSSASVKRCSAVYYFFSSKFLYGICLLK